MTSRQKYWIIHGMVWVFSGALHGVMPAEPLNHSTAPRIESISVETSRVRESVVRRQLTFREGDRLTDGLVDDSLRRLYDLNLFKSLQIEVLPDTVSDGVHVKVKGKDGWFMLPWLMAGSSGGSRYAALTLMEYNFLRRAESITLMGMRRDNETSGLLAFSLPSLAVMAGSFSSSRREYAYLDGGFSIKDFKRADDDETAADFGETVNSYHRKQRRDHLHYAFDVGPKWRFGLGGGRTTVRYEDAEQPDSLEDEQSHILTVSAQYGEGADGPAAGGFVGVFGRLFGLGMAQVHDDLQRMRSTQTRWGGRVSLDYAPEWLGSDDGFFKAAARLERRTRFARRSRLAVFTHGAWASGAPAGQLPATNREHGLRGVYAREYRGDSLLSAGGAYQHPFAFNRIGSFSIDAFVEYATVWFDGRHAAKEGVGLGLNYRFWRFPFPLGLGYTYSLDDHNGQMNFAMGGMF